mgnify:FL=1
MNELKLNHPSEEHGDYWWIFQEYVERLNDGDVLDRDEVDELEELEEEYDWCRYDCELL